MTEKKSIVEEAKKRFERARDYYADERRIATNDLKFCMADSDNLWAWPDDAQKARTSADKVCLTINLVAQHVAQISNNIRQQRPSVKVSPVDNNADKKTAEILGGLIRNIQVSCGSDAAHDMAAESAIISGEGYWRIQTEYETETSFDQVITIKPISNFQMVLIDPDSIELDKSDAKWGFVFEDINIDVAKAEYPDIDVSSWGEDVNGWSNEDTVRRAEYFYCETTDDTACILTDGTTVLKSELEKEQYGLIEKERKTKTKKWKWCKLLGGHDEPVEETEWLGKYLPIISVVGKEINVEGKVIRKGLVRDLKDQGRSINYAYSETVQTLALQNKIPYVGTAESIAGHEDQWRDANISNEAVLMYNGFDEVGNPLQAPQRQMPAVMPAAQIQLLQLSIEQMKGASGQQNANFGIKSEAASGIGIKRLQAQGEVANFHYPDNLARALRYEALVLIDLIQKYYDTRRVVRILGLDGKEDQAMLDPEQQEAHNEIDEGDIKQIFNPSVGRYDVVIDTGPSYQTQRQEAAASLNDLAGRNPEMMQKAGDLIMQAQDFPMADKIAERLEKFLPPEVREKKEGEQDPEVPPEIQQQMQQGQEMLQQMQQALQQLQQENAQLKQGQQEKMAALQQKDGEARLDADVALQKAQIDAEAKIKVVEMQIKSAEEQAELTGWFSLEQAKLTANSLPQVEETPLPKILQRKRISMMAPSGAVYEGVIQDEPEQ